MSGRFSSSREHGSVSAPGARQLRGRPRRGAQRSRSGGRKADRTGDVGTGPATTPIALVLIEDNRLLREGIAVLIRTQPGFKVLAASADVDEAIQKVREAKPNVVLLDFGLENHDSLSLTATIHDEVPEARVIVLGLLPRAEDVADYVKAGASGFIMKEASFEEFFATIRAVAAGVQVLPHALADSFFSHIARNATGEGQARTLEAVRLTNRERQIVELLGEGLSNKEIAARLHVAVHTVKSHVHNVLEKLALHSRLEVAAFTHAGGVPPARPL